MKISIIIPVYNTALYLRECLDSIFSQDYHDCEVICVNDGSTDTSLDILKDYEQRFPNNMIVLSQENQGQSVARNTAMDIATGEYIVFLDSDDYFLPNALEIIHSLVVEYSECDIIYADSVIDLTNNHRFYTIPQTTCPMELRNMFDFLWNHYCHIPIGGVWSGAFKRSFIKKNKLQMLPGTQYEDELFVVSVYTFDGLGVAIHLDHPYYAYRTNRTGSTTTYLKLKNFSDRQTICRKMYDVCHKADFLTPSMRHKIFDFYINYLCEAYINHFSCQSYRFFNKVDLEILHRCMLVSRDKKMARLVAIHPMLMAAYKTDSLPSFIRRFINRFM